MTSEDEEKEEELKGVEEEEVNFYPKCLKDLEQARVRTTHFKCSIYYYLCL
jgi:hypothetical protein